MKKRSAYERVTLTFTVLFGLFCLLPFWLTFINSFQTSASFANNGFQLWPEEFTLDGYTYVLKGTQIYRSFLISVAVTVIGLILSVTVTSMFAYGIAHRRVRYANFLSLMMYITMIMGSSMIGFYIVIKRWYDLGDTIWALVLPYLINPFFAFMMVSSFRALPFELNESAYVDGATEFRIFFQIILPISLPIIATVALFVSIRYWNDWWLALLFIDKNVNQPLQMLMRQLMSSVNAAATSSAAAADITVQSRTVQLCTVCITIGPIIFIYPFIQRYFVRGITIGAIKG